MRMIQRFKWNSQLVLLQQQLVCYVVVVSTIIVVLLLLSSQSQTQTTSSTAVSAYCPFVPYNDVRFQIRSTRIIQTSTQQQQSFYRFRYTSKKIEKRSNQQLIMHMGHSHSHHDHGITSHDGSSTAAILPEQQSQQRLSFWKISNNIIRRRRLIATMIFCVFVAILGPSFMVLQRPIQQQQQQQSVKLSTRLVTFLATSTAIIAAEPIRNYILSVVERVRILGEGISKHSTPITASYLFQNKNAADRITLLGGVINVVLSLSKFIIGITCHSSALIADAGHSLSDLFSDFVTLWAVQVARLPPDQDHPYGHGKFEAVGSLFLSLTLIGTGIGVGAMANNNLLEILAQQRRGLAISHQIPSYPALIMALISVVSKEWLFRVTRVVGQRLQSQVVIANAWHHRSDAYSSILATASIGVAMFVPGLLFVDAAAGLFVAAMIGMTGMEILGESVKQLTDTSNEELIEKVTKLANESADVDQVIRVRARQVGSASSVDISVMVPEDRTISAARAVEERLRQQILEYAGEGVVDVDVRATAPPTSNGGFACSALESQTMGNPVTAEEVESCVRDEIVRRYSDSISLVKGVSVYYRNATTVDVDVNICLKDDPTVSAARLIGSNVRVALESSSQISNARIYLDLDNN